ncbi:MAG: hypothetical protein N2253_04780 [Bacteroidia bacterium]|nr:hypothetical protein [Bacteroidia bacterium]MCX7764190.1 hypothetical protein [Bacteroidia bacterium]MDW8057244.1 hypothetical protein [Bacteroidia bacterium]
MQKVSVFDIWGAAWDRFNKKWYLGPLLILLNTIVSLIPVIGLLYMLLLPTIYPAYGLGIWKNQENSSLKDAFPSNVFIYIKVLLGIAIVFLITLAYVFIADRISSTPILLELIEGNLSYTLEELLISLIPLIFIFLLSQAVAIILTFFYPYFVIDKNAEVFSALRDSVNLAVKNLGKVILFSIIAFLVNLLGILMVGLGLLLTLPLTHVAAAGLYASLLEKEYAT